MIIIVIIYINPSIINYFLSVKLHCTQSSLHTIHITFLLIREYFTMGCVNAGTLSVQLNSQKKEGKKRKHTCSNTRAGQFYFCFFFCLHALLLLHAQRMCFILPPLLLLVLLHTSFVFCDLIFFQRSSVMHVKKELLKKSENSLMVLTSMKG